MTMVILVRKDTTASHCLSTLLRAAQGIGMKCIPEHRVLDDCGDPSFQTWQEANVAAVQRQIKVEVWHLNKGYLYGISDTSVQQIIWPDSHKHIST